MKNMKFATKLLLGILVVSVVSMIAISTISYTELLNLSEYSQDMNTQLSSYASDNSMEALIEQAESYLSRLSKSQADNCNSMLLKIQDSVSSMSDYMEQLYKNPWNFPGRELPRPDETQSGVPSSKIMIAKTAAGIEALRDEMLLVSNAEYMFSSIFAANISLNNAYLGTDSGISYRYSASNAYDPDYDPRERPWYKTAYSADNPIWLDTYVDPYGAIGTTCAMSFNGGDDCTTGVVAVDILLSTMVGEILDVRIGETGYAFLLDNHGNYLAHPRYDELDPAALETAQGEYRDILASMASGEADVRAAMIDGVYYYVAYAPLSVTGWSLGIMVEQDEIVAGALAMKEGIDSQALEAKDQMQRRLNSVMFRFIALLCISIVAVLILSILISGSVTKPITKLTNGVIQVGRGNLDEKIDIKSRDEIGVLADSFNKMTDDLMNYISDLSAATADREYIAAELDVAKQIQYSLFPCVFPAFPERNDFDIYARINGANTAGGNFYNFFLIDKTRLCLFMGDASGTGIPTAMFSVIASTLLKNYASLDYEPNRILFEVNNQLSQKNDAELTISVFLGIINLVKGTMSYTSAGDIQALYKSADSDFEALPVTKGFHLGEIEQVPYTRQTCPLFQGDMLFLYTKGLANTMDNRGNLYGNTYVKEHINEIIKSTFHLDDICNHLYKKVEDFKNGMEQEEDSSVLFFRYFHP